MSRTARPRTTGASLLTAALVGALALTGCSAGQVAGTAGQLANSAGANVQVGNIGVRDAVIPFVDQPVQGGAVYESGADAPLSMTIVNEGTDADRLVSASSVWASEVTVGGMTEIPGGRALVVEGDIAETGAEAPGGVPTVRPNTAAEGQPAGQMVLTGLLDDLRAGLTYEVVLTFERAGEVRVPVPVGDAPDEREEPTE